MLSATMALVPAPARVPSQRSLASKTEAERINEDRVYKNFIIQSVFSKKIKMQNEETETLFLYKL